MWNSLVNLELMLFWGEKNMPDIEKYIFVHLSSLDCVKILLEET